MNVGGWHWSYPTSAFGVVPGALVEYEPVPPIVSCKIMLS
jgi:hypothetical protein